MRCPIPVKNRRRVLCVFPHYTPSFGTFHHAYRLMKGVRAFMPPQGLLLIAAYMPEEWPVRFIDENIRNAMRYLIAVHVPHTTCGAFGSVTSIAVIIL